MEREITYLGPLGDLAQAEAVAGGVHPADLYVAAISWWSAAVAPAVSFAYWPGLTTLWASFVQGNTTSPTPVAPLLHSLLGTIAPLSTHPNITTERQLDAAIHTSLRADRAGNGTPSLLLTGTPFTTNHGVSTISRTLEAPLRHAWDRQHVTPTRGTNRYRCGSFRPAPPEVTVLWTPSASEWQGFTRTDAATSSRLLHFSLLSDIPDELRQTDTWRQDLSLAYAWAFTTRPLLRFSKRAGLLLDVVRYAEDDWDELDHPHADFFVRTGSHVARTAGAIAASERTTVSSAHILAAWHLTRRAVRDTARLLHMDLDAVDAAIDSLDQRLSEVPEHEGKIKRVKSNAPTYEATTKQKPSLGSAVRKLKLWYQGRCQMCGTTLRLPKPRMSYSEAAHIQSREDCGPDIIANLLCLCPNCHTLFDAGARVLTDELTIVDTVSGKHGRQLDVHRWHFIDRRYVRHHRGLWYDDRNPAT